MKIFSKHSILVALGASLMLGLAGPVAAFAAVGVAPSLGAESTYAIVGSTWTNSYTSGTGLETAIIGGVCYTTPPATAPISINGVTTTPLSLAVVPCTNGGSQTAALVDLNAQAADPSCTSLGTNVVLSGTYAPGCYKSSGTMDIVATTNITLNGQGIYIFKSGGALTTGANSKVLLSNGAIAQNVYWVPGGTATLGANAATSLTPTFVGNIIADALGSTGITIGQFVNIRGRLLAFGHTVTTDQDTVSVPTSLHVIKLVVGGVAVASNFTIHVKQNGIDVGAPTPGAAAPGTTYALSAGNYTVSEDTNSSYMQTFTGTGCDANGNVTLATGDDATCTIVNTAVPLAAAATPSASASAGGRIIPLIGILKVPSPLALPSGAGGVTYNYTVWNVGGQQALDNISVTDDKCGPVTYVSGDLNGNGKLDPHEIWTYTCLTVLGQTTTNTSIATGYSDDGNHQATIATAIATVVVGSTLTPPLINIIKVPSRLTPFPFGGGAVTYSYIVTNPGVVAMHNVSVSDNKCNPVLGPSAGDTNGNGLLDPGESWAYTCQTYVPFSTTNIATAEGTANGFTALGYAFATVLVSAPGFPNTGFPPGPIQTITDNLQQGDDSSDVAILQEFLISQNEGPAAQALSDIGATAYFGTLTRSALAEFQMSVGISPASGNFGPITRAYLSAN